jgi:hypothetical protein
MAKHKYDVFISCSAKDHSSAHELAEALKLKGVSAWMDPGTEAGKKLADQVERALKESKVFLFLLSPDFLTSKWSNFELGVALSKAALAPDTRIIPLAIKPLSKKSLPGPLRELEVIDVKNISSGQAADKVVQLLEEVPVGT